MATLLEPCRLLAAVQDAEDGPGAPKVVFHKKELFTAVGHIGKENGAPLAHSYVAMHKGYLVVVFTTDHGKGHGGFAFYDISNPTQPKLVSRVQDARTFTLGEGHGYGFVRGPHGDVVALQDGFGVQFWDWSNVRKPVRLSRITLPPLSGGNYTDTAWWLFWQARTVYVGGSNTGIHIVDATDPSRPKRVAGPIPVVQTGGFRVGPIFAIGNLLVISSMEKGQGVATLDIADPLRPTLLDAIPKSHGLYSSMVNGNRLMLVGNDEKIHVYDIGNPHKIRYTRSSPRTGGKGGYMVVQDGFVHAGMSRLYVKVALDEGMTVRGRSRPQPARGADWDFCTAVGNLVFVSDDHGNGTYLVPHQANRDTAGPAVTMVNPKDGAIGQAVTTRVGITLSDQIDLRTVTTNSFIVRPLGGNPLPGRYSHQTGIVNFWPDEPLTQDTAYEVILPAGGVRDWSGNPLAKSFRSRFSTTVVDRFALTLPQPTPATVGQTVRFALDSSRLPKPDPDAPLTFSWTFGDGTEPTPHVSDTSAKHRFEKAGHHVVLVRARKGNHGSAASFVQLVHHPVTRMAPERSTTILLDKSRRRVWCVNTDNGTVTAVDADRLKKLAESPVGANPRTIARAPSGEIWVANQGSATISRLDPDTAASKGTIRLPHASRPYGIAFRPDGAAAFVTLEAIGKIAILDPRHPSASPRFVDIGPHPRGIAVTADSGRVFVTRLLSPRTHGELVELDGKGNFIKRHRLAYDRSPDREDAGRGVPNYLGSPTISPDGRRLWIPSKKDNTARGLARDGRKLTFESTVRTIVSQFDLVNSTEIVSARNDLDDRDMAAAVVFSPLGDLSFVACQGSNVVDVFRAYDNRKVTSILDTGLAPQGLVLDAQTGRLFVHNFMSRTIAAFDVRGVLDRSRPTAKRLAEISTVAHERLGADVLRGKQIFYNARDSRMSKDGYISCATCHLEGNQDGRVWDFTDRGEGLRNTISLLGRSGTGHGRVHWTANFDEIQDFEHDIRGPFGGTGFLSDKRFKSGRRNQSLGGKKAGFSAQLDALAAYVRSLDAVRASPHRRANGLLTPEGAAGKELFDRLGCRRCHAGPEFTDSAKGLLHDVGTIGPKSGRRMNKALAGLDTPTLKGVWESAPYLHDGSADTLEQVLTTRNAKQLHGRTAGLSRQQIRQLVAYLLQIDESESVRP